MDLQLKNKVVLVSGGAKGIGEGITRVLSQEGAMPVIVGRNEADNLKVVDSLRSLGLNADFVTADLVNPESCESVANTVASRYGNIHGLVNNAGTNDGVGLESGNYQSFLASLHKNLIHYYLLAHFALPYLKQSRGSIVNIGSKTAETGQGGTSAYAAANGGKNALTREWAVELRKFGIRVNAVIVAECLTPMYDAWIQGFDNPEQKLKEIQSRIPFENRFTTADEIANMVAFLLSPVSSHTTGQLVHVDGGYVHLDRALD